MQFFKIFQFISLVLLLAIIAFFMTIYVIKPEWVNPKRCSEQALAKAQIKYFQESLDFYYNENLHFPDTHQGLKELLRKNKNGKPYIKFVKKDPWLVPFYYQCPGTHNKDSYDLWTYGADKKPGGEGENSDICNW